MNKKETKEMMLGFLNKANSFFVICDNGDVPEKEQGLHFGGSISRNELFEALGYLEKKFPEVFLDFFMERIAELQEINIPDKNKLN
jgi:hydroxymethylpyrimidine pyrophosphatase-like HAD family hydrolase